MEEISYFNFFTQRMEANNRILEIYQKCDILFPQKDSVCHISVTAEKVG
jgi:hypothetical protein